MPNSFSGQSSQRSPKPSRLSLTISLLLLVCVFISCSQKEPIEKIQNAEKLMEQVSIPRLSGTINNLVSFKTRYPHEKQTQAADYIFSVMSRHIPETTYHEYEHWGVKWRNVVGTIKGRKDPEQIVIVCSHMDSKSEKRLVYAPGADDNASGCAAVLEAARLLSEHDFEKTIRLIVFSREEDGQDGSKAYVREIAKQKEKVVATINLDMIAFGPEVEDIDLVTRPIMDPVFQTAP